MTKRVVVTGGLGYVGSHIVKELLGAGYYVTVTDNCSTGWNRIKEFEEEFSHELWTNKLQRHSDLPGVYFREPPVAVICCAGYKSVPDSYRDPRKYWRNNLSALLDATSLGVPVIFSSTAAVYGPDCVTVGPQSPYARTKLICENMLQQLTLQGGIPSSVALRYFNPVGHASWLLREKSLNNTQLFPRMLEGKVTLYANGEQTRDYISVIDLAKAHLAALTFVENPENSGVHRVTNVGSGKGMTTNDFVELYRSVNPTVALEVTKSADVRQGDPHKLVANLDPNCPILSTWARPTQTSLAESLRVPT